MMKLALVQDAPVLGDVEATLARMQDIVRKTCRDNSVDLVVFPELFITGYLPEHWSFLPTAEAELEWLVRLQSMAAECDVWVIVGHPSYRVRVTDGAKRPELTNAASIISPDGIVGTYAKVHLFGDEGKTFVAGRSWPVWRSPWGKIAVQICYDIEFPESARMAGLQDADLLVNISANMVPYGSYHRIYAQARAMENTMFVACLNRTGMENGINFCGESCVVHPDSSWLLQADSESGVFVVDVPLHERRNLPDCVQYVKMRQPHVYKSLAESPMD
ncbi:carbon-nitrogen hydrolase family protein [Alicyclobacillus suci]|uniref:carbon-nitrogen hydrolase family protein n=1 Tax=Alicyclobacillus suci TaxID=2816080 RepID=UPI001A902385|nr:carbon-nitrogen hydrolase family protein [Alicyclobacillus suci]